MFGEATILVGSAHQRLAVPTVAVTYSTFGDYVYVIKTRSAADHEQQVAVSTPIRAGQARGSLTEVLSGLSAGERVVTAGQIKLRNGTPVVIHRRSAR